MTPYDAYPLTWPVGWKRTPSEQRHSGRYQVTFAKARDEVLRSLERLGARDIVVSTNIPLRRDGLPYAGMREPDDRGVAVYWADARGKQAVIACDCWLTVRDNLRADGLTLEALRSIERASASELLDRAFTGFAALPADIHVRNWRDVFNLGSQVINRDQVEDVYRALAHVRHPDAGGTHEQMVELNRAREQALREVS